MISDFIGKVHGGGGKGIVKVDRAEQLHQLFHQVTTEARSAFGNGDVYRKVRDFIASY